MESLTATVLKKAIANSDADRREIEKAIEFKPPETQDQLLNIRSHLTDQNAIATAIMTEPLHHQSWVERPERGDVAELQQLAIFVARLWLKKRVSSPRRRLMAINVLWNNVETSALS